MTSDAGRIRAHEITLLYVAEAIRERAMLEIVAAIGAAEDHEREACAKIADTAVQMSGLVGGAPMGSKEQKVLIGEAMAETAKLIANSIRERK